LGSLPPGYWVAGDGSHSVTVPAGAVSDIHGTGVTGYAGSFTLDLTPPRVVSSSVQENDVVTYSGSLTTGLSYTVGFSEAMNTGLVNNSAFALHGAFRNANYTPSGLTWSADGTSLTVTYANLPDDRYTLTLFSSRFQDLVGWNLDGERPAGTISSDNPSGDGV